MLAAAASDHVDSRESSRRLGDRNPLSDTTGDQLPTTTSQRLQSLRPTPLRPCHVATHHEQDVVALQRIEYLEIRENIPRTGGTVYRVDIFYHDTLSRIPVHGRFGETMSTRSTPSGTVYATYDDFLQLSHSTYALTRVGHVTDACSLCRTVDSFHTAMKLKLRLTTHCFKSERQVCAMLTAYLREMLARAIDVTTQDVDRCRMRAHVLRLLRKFLRLDDEDERQSLQLL